MERRFLNRRDAFRSNSGAWESAPPPALSHVGQDASCLRPNRIANLPQLGEVVRRCCQLTDVIPPSRREPDLNYPAGCTALLP